MKLIFVLTVLQQQNHLQHAEASADDDSSNHKDSAKPVLQKVFLSTL